MAVILNFSQYVGEDKSQSATICLSDGITPANITNWTLIWKVGTYTNPYMVLFSKTPIIINPSTGSIILSTISSDTINLSPGQYAFTVERVDPGSETVCILGLWTLLSRQP